MSTDPGRLRISDADREAAVELLRESVAEGRLTIGEFDERSQQVYESKTRAELELIFDDLPVNLPGAGTVVKREPEARGGAREGEVLDREEDDEDEDDENVTVLEAFQPLIWGGGITTSIWLASVLSSGQVAGFWPVWVIIPTLFVGVARLMNSKNKRRDC
ncbi:DUF1707 SHOCT-like domain-containing protein [Salininema proteolyticum]|uniref:DUF1707 domain-containing protein n=1 Tax=Salininema proteolyticum TaxID=1607685 RepID=A0ABV8TZ60_9ACTN